MKIKTFIEEDFNNYKKPAMLIGFPTCTFKCNRECGKQVCHNEELIHSPNIEISIQDLIDVYANNKITSAIVCGGLEPFDSWDDLFEFVLKFRNAECYDPIVIYTGYNYDEIESKIKILKAFRNIIVKFGRFIPNQQHHFDETLGVELASPNQYGKRIS